ncbi:hypothetical protein AXF42_Ash018065 [Apostasia shenzhenica]|uniref:Uncharacterized protein n=1 Tax=Apostasia shenzhenica TaxID=1088818 RepID=A0A2I0AVN2_9ASPA|nr:hypothetical protein AXF42_Ash018065 [Apostasia shenzhenica]
MAASLCSTVSPLVPVSRSTAGRRKRERLPANRDFRCQFQKPGPSAGDTGSSPENAVLRLAWYGSELLGIASSFFRPAPQAPPGEIPEVGDSMSAPVDHARVVESIKDDFKRSYFVTGSLTTSVYNEDCEFADPAASFKGLHRFKRNCSNFGNILEKSDMKLMKWEEYEDKGIGHWRFSCVMSFPWRPILSATGYTEYYFDKHSGRICRHVEHWNVPKMALLKQIFRPSRWIWDKS